MANCSKLEELQACNAESTFAETETTSRNEQVIIVGRAQGDLAVERVVTGCICL